MFSDELKNISWEETTERIARMTDNDVRRALAKDHCDVNDFMALISPAAEPYLEVMARLSRKYTEERFGRPCRCSSLSTSPTRALTRACTAASIVRIRWLVPSSPERLRTSTSHQEAGSIREPASCYGREPSQGWHPISCQGNRHRQEVFL